MASRLNGLRRRTLRGAIGGFLALTITAGVLLPPFLSGGRYLADPAFWAAMVGAPAFLALWSMARRRPVDQIAPWFVGVAMLEAWVFTVLIQGSGYLVGNYAYLTVIVLLAAFFLSARSTAFYAGANLVGVIVVSAVWGLALTDLLLSIVYIVLFSGMLVLIATTFEHNAAQFARANQDLQQMQARQQQIMDTTQDSIIALDASHRLLSCNARGATMFEQAAGQPPRIGHPLAAQLPAAMQETFALLLEQYAASGVAEVEQAYETPAGPRAYRARLCRLPGGSGDAILLTTDVTQHHLRMTEERERLVKEAEMEKLRGLHEMQRSFINVASHELQTPLTPLRLQARLLRQRAGVALGPAERKSIEIIERNTERMARLVDDVLEVVRIGSGRLPIEKHRVDVAALVRQSVEDHRPAATERHLILTTTAPDHLWATADDHRIEQVLNNLIRNALRFTQPGGRVTVAATSLGDLCRIEVEDDGIGMEPSQTDRLFQPFVQLHEEQFPRTGTGLGLAICKGLVEAHGGTIGVHSDGPGKGARFTVEFPLHADGPERPPRPPHGPLRPPRALARPPPRAPPPSTAWSAAKALARGVPAPPGLPSTAKARAGNTPAGPL